MFMFMHIAHKLQLYHYYCPFCRFNGFQPHFFPVRIQFALSTFCILLFIAKLQLLRSRTVFPYIFSVCFVDFRFSVNESKMYRIFGISLCFNKILNRQINTVENVCSLARNAKGKTFENQSPSRQSSPCQGQ